MRRFYLLITTSFLVLSLGWAFANENKKPKPAIDLEAKAEADYQKFIKDHVNHKLLTVKYDKFKALTSIDVDARMTNELGFKTPKGGGTHLDFIAGGGIPDKPTKKNPAFAYFLITSHTDDWVYLKCHDFNWLVDDKPFKWKEELYDSSVITGGVNEFFEIFLTPTQLNNLVNAQKIEFKICNDEFIFTYKQFWVISWVNKQLQDLLKGKKGKSSQNEN